MRADIEGDESSEDIIARSVPATQLSQYTRRVRLQPAESDLNTNHYRYQREREDRRSVPRDFVVCGSKSELYLHLPSNT